MPASLPMRRMGAAAVARGSGVGSLRAATMRARRWTGRERGGTPWWAGSRSGSITPRAVCRRLPDRAGLVGPQGGDKALAARRVKSFSFATAQGAGGQPGAWAAPSRMRASSSSQEPPAGPGEDLAAPEWADQLGRQQAAGPPAARTSSMARKPEPPTASRSDRAAPPLPCRP